MDGRQTCLAILCFLHCCAALNLTCNASQDGNRTVYKIVDVFAVLDANPTNCEFQWTNASNHVLANHMSKDHSVISSTIDTLVTSGCVPDAGFKRNCISEGREFTAVCNISCTKKPQDLTDQESSHNWNLLALIVVPVIGIVVLCYCFRDRILRKGTCGQVGGFYTSVKMTSAKPTAVVVEV